MQKYSRDTLAESHRFFHNSSTAFVFSMSVDFFISEKLEAVMYWTLTVIAGPKMVAVKNYHGTPVPPGKTPLCFQTGDFIELLKGDPDITWWEVE